MLFWVFDIVMQGALLGIFRVAIILIAGPGYAQNFNLPWCAILDTNGTTQCSYYTQQQCLETLSGLGGECIANPSAGTPTMGPARRRQGPAPGHP